MKKILALLVLAACALASPTVVAARGANPYPGFGCSYTTYTQPNDSTTYITVTAFGVPIQEEGLHLDWIMSQRNASGTQRHTSLSDGGGADEDPTTSTIEAATVFSGGFSWTVAIVQNTDHAVVASAKCSRTRS